MLSWRKWVLVLAVVGVLGAGYWFRNQSQRPVIVGDATLAVDELGLRTVTVHSGNTVTVNGISVALQPPRMIDAETLELTTVVDKPADVPGFVVVEDVGLENSSAWSKAKARDGTQHLVCTWKFTVKPGTAYINPEVNLHLNRPQRLQVLKFKGLTPGGPSNTRQAGNNKVTITALTINKPVDIHKWSFESPYSMGPLSEEYVSIKVEGESAYAWDAFMDYGLDTISARVTDDRGDTWEQIDHRESPPRDPPFPSLGQPNLLERTVMRFDLERGMAMELRRMCKETQLLAERRLVFDGPRLYIFPAIHPEPKELSLELPWVLPLTNRDRMKIVFENLPITPGP